MKTSLKIVISQIVSLIGAYFVAGWIGGYREGTAFDISATAFISFVMLPFVYLFLITLIANLWFQSINKWNFLIPAILIFVLTIVLSLDSSSDYILYKMWLGAFFGGWILAKILNFVVRFAKK